MNRFPSLPYIAPFAVLLGFLALHSTVAFPERTDQLLRIAVVGAVLLLISRRALDFRVRNLWTTLAIGIAVFAIWIAPDWIAPAYRQSWLFQNAVLGAARSSIPASALHEPAILALRSFRAAVIVPIVEELFWRAWLLRWIISTDFQKIQLGTYTAASFWAVAALFASEHGSYWDVGFAAGVIYNWWMIRTKSLGDLILAHAVTNACLSGYVIAAGKWEYWL